MHPYDAIFFDFDGVLVDSEPAHQQSWADVLAPLGIHLDWHAYREHYIGVDDRVMLASLCAGARPPVPFETAWDRYRAKKQLFEQRMHRPGVIAREIAALLTTLRQNVKIAVVTSSARSEVEPILKTSGLLPEIDTVVYGEDVERHKPDPEPYQLAASRLGASRPLVVEDSPAGLEAGRAAGFDVLHIPAQADMCRLLRTRLQLPSDHHDSEPQQRRR